MTLFINSNAESAIAQIEFAGAPDAGQFVVLHARTRMEPEKISQWLQNNGLNLEEITRTHVDGREVLITRSALPQEKILQTLQSHGEALTENIPAKKLNPWKLRGWASIIGQPMQLASGMLQKGTIDPATIGFASANMIANVTNIVFGAEKKDDPNRLLFLKEAVNRDVDEHLPAGTNPPDPTSSRMDERVKPDETKKFDSYDFMKRNSVRIGEIGLRYIGALSLAFPFVKAIPGKKPWSVAGLTEGTAHWKKGVQQLGAGKFGEAYKTIANKDQFTRNAGLAYLFGKSIAFGAQVPDAYSGEPHTAVDTTREKILFPASSMIEAVAAGLIAYNGLFKRKINWNQKFMPKALHFGETRDYLGGIGGLLFTTGLIIRIFAPFGKKELDMQEISAHISDTLSKTPPEQMPRLLADSAATVFEHSKDSGATFGSIFASMANDMSQHYHIALNAPANANASAQVAGQQPQEPAQEAASFASRAPRKTDEAGRHTAMAKPADSHTERQLRNNNDAIQLTV